MTAQSMNVMKYHILVWKICGVWPPQHKPIWYTIYSALLFGIIFVIFPTLIVLNLFVVKNLNGVIETLLPYSTCALASVKGFFIYRKRNKITKLFDIITQLDAAVKTDEQHEMIEKALKESKHLVILLSCLYYCGVNSAFLLAFLSKDTILMWPSLIPFDFEHNYVLYNCIIFYQYISSLFVAIIDTSADVYGSCLNKILGAHIDVLGMQLQSLGYNGNNDGNGSFNNEDIDTLKGYSINEKNMKHCAIYYNHCIRFSKCLDDILSLHYFVQFGTSGLVICVSAFQLSVIQPLANFSKFLFVCEYLFSMTIEIFIPCYYGSIVTIKSSDLTLKIYKSNWINQSTSFTSSMKIFMERTLRPIVPYAGGLFLIGLPTFINILRAAYSLLACLKSLE